MHTYAHPHKDTCMHVHGRTHARMHTHTHTYIHIHRQLMHNEECSPPYQFSFYTVELSTNHKYTRKEIVVRACMSTYTCMRTCAHTHKHRNTQKHTHKNIQTHTHIHKHTHKHTCAHARTHTYTHTHARVHTHTTHKHNFIRLDTIKTLILIHYQLVQH